MTFKPIRGEAAREAQGSELAVAVYYCAEAKISLLPVGMESNNNNVIVVTSKASACESSRPLKGRVARAANLQKVYQ